MSRNMDIWYLFHLQLGQLDGQNYPPSPRPKFQFFKFQNKSISRILSNMLRISTFASLEALEKIET